MVTPVKVKLEADKVHYFCTCSKSEDGVLCDGSHKGTDYKPQQFTVEKTKEYSLCACKKSKKLPFCDGTHRKL
jgi:CDGSH-type Zn-finger protein